MVEDLFGRFVDGVERHEFRLTAAVVWRTLLH